MEENAKTDNTKFLYSLVGVLTAMVIGMLAWFLITLDSRTSTNQTKNSENTATLADMSSKVDMIPEIITAQNANTTTLAAMKSQVDVIPEIITAQNANTTTLAAMKSQVDVIPEIITTQQENSKLLARVDERTSLMGEDIDEIRKDVDILQSQNLEQSELLNSILQLLQNPEVVSNLQNRLTQSPN